MGLDNITSDFLNWCMANRDYVEWARDKKINLEFIMDCKTLEAKSRPIILHFDDTNFIGKIEDIRQYKRLKISRPLDNRL